ncbi:MAG: tryptophan synthase subunit alpha [Oscillospiraceae bacterium]|nr:tryptophan synthase subunit alpha [Oscillospiraceae bacterium]
MNNSDKIAAAFDGKKAFIAFITGGDPDIETTEKLIIEMADCGVDIIEIGIPFSDPVAEGIVIQQADERALAGGCTLDKLFEMVGRVRLKISIPLLFMTYINPIFVYGKEKFLQNCAACGIDGVIVPDLPFEERGELADDCIKYNVAQISMVAPTSLEIPRAIEMNSMAAVAADGGGHRLCRCHSNPESINALRDCYSERFTKIAEGAKGFIYCVSSLGVTGVRSEISTDIAGIIRQIKQVTDTPCAIGFGISTPEQARDMARISDGVIIGSAIVRIVAEHGRECVSAVGEYVRAVKESVLDI